MVFKSRLLENYCCLYNALHCKIHRYVSAVTCGGGEQIVQFGKVQCLDSDSDCLLLQAAKAITKVF